MSRNFDRKKVFTIAETEGFLKSIVMDFINGTNRIRQDITIDNVKMHAISDRYKLFFTKGYKCVNCGLEGKFFALEKRKTDTIYHLNLYGYDKNGNEILFTKDHIIPKSKGGKDILENYQTMCEKCNMRKGNKMDGEPEVEKIPKKYNSNFFTSEPIGEKEIFLIQYKGKQFVNIHQNRKKVIFVDTPNGSKHYIARNIEKILHTAIDAGLLKDTDLSHYKAISNKIINEHLSN